MGGKRGAGPAWVPWRVCPARRSVAEKAVSSSHWPRAQGLTELEYYEYHADLPWSVVSKPEYGTIVQIHHTPSSRTFLPLHPSPAWSTRNTGGTTLAKSCTAAGPQSSHTFLPLP